MGRVGLRRQIALAPAGRRPVPERVQWLGEEMLKTRVAHGYCSRHLAAGACAYANICETCDNFAPAPEFVPVMEGQLADVHQLRADAERRGWASEADRHGRVIDALEGHLRRLENAASS